MTSTALPPVVDADTWEAALADLRIREKAATRELDAIAAPAGASRWWRCPTTRSRAPTARFGSSTCSRASAS